MPESGPSVERRPPASGLKPHIADRMAARVRVDRAGHFSPGFARFMHRILGPAVRFAFRPTLYGWEHFPHGRPYLIVANHSGGGWAEILSLTWLWITHSDTNSGEDVPPMAGMAHPSLFFLPGFGRVLRGVGAIPSTYAAAEDAVGKGIPVLVFPGGDYEAFRPVWQASRVDFAGREGFLKLARKARVPIVPVGIRGSHITAPMLWRSRALAWMAIYPRLLGGKRVPVSVLGVIGTVLLVTLLGPVIGYALSSVLGFVWLTCPLVFLIPIVPSRIRVVVGKKVEPEELFGRDDYGSLTDAYNRIQGTVQELVLRRINEAGS